MKSFHRTFLLAVLAVTSAAAQTPPETAGVVLYEVVTQIPPPSLPPEFADLAPDLPTSMEETRQLRFAGDRAVTEVVVAPDLGFGIQAPTMGPYFVDRGAGRAIRQATQFRETVLIEGDAEAIRWRLGAEEAEFLGYPVQRATAMRSSVGGAVQVEAWFTPAIPVSHGPDLFNGLPGLVLVVSEDGGRRTFKATEVDLSGSHGEIAEPTGGRSVTAKEYEQFLERMSAEMDARSERALEEMRGGN